MKNLSGVVLALLSGLSFSGCLFLTTGTSNNGSARFTWAFAGQTSCSAAGVTQVQVSVLQGTGGSAVIQDTLPCDSETHEVGPLREGEYTLVLEGLDAAGLPDFVAERTFVVLGGRTSELGTINLDLLFATVLVDWTFNVPGTGMAMPTPVCDVAGVVDLVLTLSTSSQVVLTTDPLDCLEPVTIEDVAPGQYFITLEAYGLYNNIPILLYTATDVPVTVGTDPVTDVGQILMQPFEENFGALDIEVSFSGTNCTALGDVDVNVDVFQGSVQDPVDSFRFDCPANQTVRNLAVPGNHEIVATASSVEMGNTVQWRAAAMTNVAPGQTQQVRLTLQEQ